MDSEPRTISLRSRVLTPYVYMHTCLCSSGERKGLVALPVCFAQRARARRGQCRRATSDRLSTRGVLGVVPALMWARHTRPQHFPLATLPWLVCSAHNERPSRAGPDGCEGRRAGASMPLAPALTQPRALASAIVAPTRVPAWRNGIPPSIASHPNSHRCLCLHCSA